jgi:hypothetical protein
MDAVVHPANNGGGWACEGVAVCEEEEEDEGARPIAGAAIFIVFSAE